MQSILNQSMTWVPQTNGAGFECVGKGGLGEDKEGGVLRGLLLGTRFLTTTSPVVISLSLVRSIQRKIYYTDAEG